LSYDTAANILNDAAVELGLYATDLADPYESTDANVIQLRRLLKGLGQDLARDHQWSHLQAEYTFNTSIGVYGYALPDGFLRLIDQTQYNRTRQERLDGPLSAQGWQYLKALSAAGTVEFWFRVKGAEIHLYPTPTANFSMAMEYVSGLWVAAPDDVNPSMDAPTVGTHILWFDRRLLVCGLKLAFQRAKGFDSTAAQSDFNEALARALGGDGAAPVLGLNSRGVLAQRLVGPGNLPDTGYGS
jgi:hypothetical protein